MCGCHSIPECCVMFSGVKLSMGSFVLFIGKEILISSTVTNITVDFKNLANDLFTLVLLW